jgi:hypothetical protein
MNYSPDSRYAFGGELFFRLHMNEHIRYLGQLLQHRVLNQIGNAVSLARVPR